MIFPQFSHGFPIYLATVKFDRTIHLHQTATADDGQSPVDTAGSGTPAMGNPLNMEACRLKIIKRAIFQQLLSY